MLQLPQECSLIAFADNALLFCKSKFDNDVGSKCNTALNTVFSRGKENKLTFNPSKTTAMFVTRHRDFVLHSITMDNQH